MRSRRRAHYSRPRSPEQVRRWLKPAIDYRDEAIARIVPNLEQLAAGGVPRSAYVKMLWGGRRGHGTFDAVQ
jgi:hypothetical protein